MKTIYKYEIPATQKAVTMKKDAEILSVAFQDQTLSIWAKVNSDNPDELKSFRVYGTGHAIFGDDENISIQFVGTAFHPAGFVFHVFSVEENN